MTPGAIYYCEQCGRRVREADLAEGGGIAADGKVFCPDCAPDVPDLAPARKEAPRRPGRDSRARGHAQAAGKRSPLVPFGIAFGGGGLLSCLVILLMRGDRGDSGRGREATRAPDVAAAPSPPTAPGPARAPAPPRAEVPAAPATVISPERARPAPEAPPVPTREAVASVNDNIQAEIASWTLDQAKAAFAANPNDIRTFREKLERLRQSHAGTKAAEEAAGLLEEVKLPELPPERDPKPPSADAWARAVQVLPSVDPAADRLNGNWRMDAGVLRSDKGMWARIGLPYVLPEEYDVRVVFERVENADCLLVILSRGGRPFLFSIGGAGNIGCSFEDITESGPDILPTKMTQTEVLPRDGRHTAVILVRRGCLRAYVDGKPMVGCQVDDDGLALPFDLRLPQTGQIGLATWNTVFVFNSLEVLPVAGEGRFLR